ncbi:MAG: NAD(+) synthase, partial [Candidatus Sungbacteria bacterium]|nr:NAD(+) synthase [Candidatus Sungbacteria bacterium]
EGKIFNTAVVIHNGKILGIVPKTYIPGYKEFYEERWFSPARDLLKKEIKLLGQTVPIGSDLLFQIGVDSDIILGIEICEDLWAPLPPSSFQVLRGANIIANLSASNELIGKADYRRLLVSQQSARGVSGYIYSSSGVHESTTDVVFSGHALIAENGSILAESDRFKREGEMIVSEIDLERLVIDRERMTSFGESIHESPKKDFRFVSIPFRSAPLRALNRKMDPNPFVPQNSAERDKRAKEIFSIQIAALAKRLEYSKIDKMVLGLSGGLDSTLAFHVEVKTADELNIPRKNILTFSLPGFGTSKRTRNNAKLLAESLGASMEEIDIKNGVSQLFKDIKHDSKIQNPVYENAQARFRTLELMSKA